MSNSDSFNSDTILLVKVICAIGFLASSAFGLILSHRLRKSEFILNIVPLSGAAAAGTLLSLWIFHMVLELSTILQSSIFVIRVGKNEFPVPLFFFFFGFFIMLVAFVYSHDTSQIKPVEVDCSERVADDLKCEPVVINKDLVAGEGVEEVRTSATSLGAEQYDAKIVGSLDICATLNAKFNNRLVAVNWSFVLSGVAFAAHSFFEGFAAGAGSSPQSIFFTTLALLLHKWVETFILSINIRDSDKSVVYWSTIAAASLASPLGILLEGVLSSLPASISDSLNALSSGVLLFICFHLIHDSFLAHHAIKGKKMLVFCVGSITLAATVFVNLAVSEE